MDLELIAEHSIPLINTAPHGLRAHRGTLYTTCQHCTTRTWSSSRNPLLHLSTLYHMDLELSAEPSIPPVNTVPHGLRAQRSVNTRESDGKLVGKEAGLRAQRGTQYSTSQHTATWRPDRVCEKRDGAQRGALCSITQHSTADRPHQKLRVQHGTIYTTCQHCTTWT